MSESSDIEVLFLRIADIESETRKQAATLTKIKRFASTIEWAGERDGERACLSCGAMAHGERLHFDDCEWFASFGKKEGPTAQ